MERIKEKLQKTPLWLKMFFSVLIILIAAFLILGFIYPNKKISESGKQTGVKTVKVHGTFSYTGIIEKINTDKIIFKAKQQLNPSLAKDCLITALVNKTTKYYKIKVPQKTPQEVKKGEGKLIFKREKTTLSSLQPGQKIIVVSAEDIGGKTKFLADRVQVIE